MIREYAMLYLERELDIIDNDYIYVEDPETGRLLEIENPLYDHAIHDSPYYRSQIASDLMRLKGHEQ